VNTSRAAELQGRTRATLLGHLRANDLGEHHVTGQPFHEWLHDRAIAAGFNVDAARGGRTALAEAAGMSVTQIGRTLEGKTTPSVESQRGLARALRIPFSEMLIQSGFATPDDFPNVTISLAPANSLDAVADHLRVTDGEREILTAMIELSVSMIRTEVAKLAASREQPKPSDAESPE
jgi:transcriptional regulator with XRE-family HTH domain